MGKRNMRSVDVKFLGLVLISLLTLASWGQAFSSVPQSSNMHEVFLPLVVKPPQALVISQVKVIQGSSLSESYAVYIAGRDTWVRAFVKTMGGDAVSEVTGRLCGYAIEGHSLGCVFADNGAISAPSEEGIWESTLNFHLPRTWVKPGFNYHVDLNPTDLNSNNDTASASFPATGKALINFVSAPDLDVVVVPVEYRPHQSAQTFLPNVDDLSYLTHLPIKVFPVSTVNYYDHPTFTFAPSNSDENLDQPEGWIKLLGDLTALHTMEDQSGSKHFYGLANSYDAHGCPGGCVTGIGWLGGSGGHKTAVGWSGFGSGSFAASETMVHEMGHSFDRKHVACSGKENNIDEHYPYPNGAIGQFGLDVTSGLLFHPDEYVDFMSYCEPTWTSDYTYWNIYQYRQNTGLSAALSTEAVDALYISGVIAPDGEVTLRPVYRQRARVPILDSGEYMLELLDSGGNLAASHPFTPLQIADSGGYKGFGFFVPAEENLSGLRVLHEGQNLLEKHATQELSGGIQHGSAVVTDSAGGLRLRLTSQPEVDLVYRIRYSPDEGETWHVLALDWPEETFSLPAGLDAGWLEVQVSEGVNTRTMMIRLP